MMEALVGQPYNPHLKKVLKTYQLSAPKSLQGPSTALTEAVKKETTRPSPEPFTTPPPLPIQQLPILTAPDRSRSERSETVLEGEPITCFVVGGEKRLCLPQILNSVLQDFSLQQINQVCADLQIYCSRCNAEQLDELKVSGILPTSAPSCGLITKTDAERLCSALLHRPLASPVTAIDKPRLAFIVYHECFGKCRGLCWPDLYIQEDAGCIQCLECHGFLSPRQFVCHAHRNAENRTCHWGFDSDNWRSYLLLSREQPDIEAKEKLLKHFKEQQFDYPLKRKQVIESPPTVVEGTRLDEDEGVVEVKKTKLEEPYFPTTYIPPYDAYAYYWCDPFNSAFRPTWQMLGHIKEKALRDSVPFLSTDPPILLHPEKVVPLSQSERFERTFQPNVALAPPSHRIAIEPTKTEIKTDPAEKEERMLIRRHVVNGRSLFNPEELSSTDTDDSASDQLESGSVVDQVAAVFAALSDAKEATRQRVIGVVERLAGKLKSLDDDNTRLRDENRTLKESNDQATKVIEQLKSKMEKLQGEQECPKMENDKKPEKEEIVSESEEVKDSVKGKEINEVSTTSVAVSVVRSSPVSVITSPFSIKTEVPSSD